MADILRQAGSLDSNIVCLKDCLCGCDRTFRRALLNALAFEGFDLEEAFPIFQLPQEILDPVGWLGTRRPGSSWNVFRASMHDFNQGDRVRS